jgi:hypothetical protein
MAAGYAYLSKAHPAGRRAYAPRMTIQPGDRLAAGPGRNKDPIRCLLPSLFQLLPKISSLQTQLRRIPQAFPDERQRQLMPLRFSALQKWQGPKMVTSSGQRLPPPG